MKKLICLIVLTLILGLVLTGCLLSNVGQVPTNEQSGITYLTKNGLLPDLVGLWRFNEGSGTIAYDNSGKDNHGTIFGASWDDGQSGFGKALSFDGNDYVEVPHAIILNPTSAITVECWAKLDRVDVHSVLVRKMNTYSLQVTVGLNGEGARLEGWVKIGGAWKGVRGVVGGTTLTSGTWYHFAFTYDGANVVTYVNRTLDRSKGVTGSIDSTTNMVNIGRCGPPETVYCYTYGLIDEVRIWNVALLPEQLDSIIYDWDGFFRPVDNLPIWNAAKAGSAIPVKFSLNGDQGLDIFEVDYPNSYKINCDTTAPLDDLEETVTAGGGSSLNYDATDDQYIYVWKTDKSWAGSCRQLVVRLNDGTSHEANFKFK